MSGSVLLLIAAIWAAAHGQDRAATPGKRAPAPRFEPSKVSEYFFDDVFSKLVGERPSSTTVTATAGPAASSTAPATASGTSGGAGWSKLISATTIEDEIKSIKQEVDKNVSTPTDFAGRGHKVIRREFSILAMLFAVINEYDGEVRFKRDAATAKSLFARTANNTKAGGNANVFNEAKLRKADLDDLLNGAAISSPAGEEALDWGTTIDRSPLMQRLEASHQSRLSPLLASKDEFSKNVGTVLHESELIAVMASVLAKEGMSDSDDDTYTGFADSMQQAAQDIAAAVKLNNYDQARAAAGKIDKACSQCHESYR